MKKVLGVLMVMFFVFTIYGEIKEMPSWVDEAIKTGNSSKKSPQCYLQKKFIGMKFNYGTISSPFSRVATAAWEAKNKLMVFKKENVTAEMIEPVAIVVIPPFIGKKVKDPHRDAEHVVLSKKYKSKKQKLENVIQPIKIEKMLASKSNLFGVKVEKQGLIATFPIDSIKEKYGFFLMYEKKPLVKSKFKVKITKKMIKKLFGK